MSKKENGNKTKAGSIVTQAQEQTTALAAPAPTGETAMAAYEYGDDAGLGRENQDTNDNLIPFLTPLQALSKILSKDRAKFQPGMLLDSVTEEVYDGGKGVLFVPATTRRYFVEWTPRDKGGGFRGLHEPESRAVQDALAAHAARGGEFGKIKLGENDLVETFYVYAALVDEHQPIGMAVMAFKKAMIKSYKRWNASTLKVLVPGPGGRKVSPPLFAHLSRIRTVFDKRPQGEFYNVILEPANGDAMSSLLAPRDPRYQAAKQVYELVMSGAAKVNYDQESSGDGGGDQEVEGIM